MANARVGQKESSPFLREAPLAKSLTVHRDTVNGTGGEAGSEPAEKREEGRGEKERVKQRRIDRNKSE